MKKSFILTIAAFAMASAVFAQTEVKDSIWAAKEAIKAKKAQDAADLKAFKEKQKADLAAFIDAQKKGKKTDIQVEKPALANAGDSLGYMYGIAMSQGLKQYATGQLGVAEDHFDTFVQGILDRSNADPNDKEKAAHSAGESTGGQILQNAKRFSDDYYSADEGMSVDPKIIVSGLVAALYGKSDMTAEDAGKELNTKMQARQTANQEKKYAANRIAGEKFLEENKTKEGVITTASGLQYKVIKMGTGEKPTAKQKVSVDYEGRLIDGTVFDSSYKRGKPTSFQVNQVIKGWTEALEMMPVGSEWELYIPYQLAYGERETGKDIKPYSALIFKVELHEIEI